MSAPIPTHTSARDDGGGGHPYRHFDRSEAEWRNLLPLMVRAALRREISRLRVSSEQLPSAPYRHAAPLEMTVAAGTPIVISTEAKQSGKSPSSDCTGGITAGDLSTQSIIGAVTVCPIPARSPARDDGGGGHPYRHFDRSGAEWRNLTPLMTEKPARALSSFRPKRSGVEKSHATMVHEVLRQEISRLRVS